MLIHYRLIEKKPVVAITQKVLVAARASPAELHIIHVYHLVGMSLSRSRLQNSIEEVALRIIFALAKSVPGERPKAAFVFDASFVQSLN